MKHFFFVLSILSFSFVANAQFQESTVDTSWKKNYRESSPRINDLVHTKLDVRFDYDKSYMYGKEWLTLKPTCNPTDSLLLDAKGMDIKTVAVVKGALKSPLKYTYDGMQLNIHLDKSYSNK